MTTDAIQEDVSTEAAEPAEAPVLSQRELDMQAIQQEIADRYGEPAYPHQPVTDVVPENPAEPVVEQEPTPAAAATPEKVRVKLDGEETEVTLEELKKGYQKGSVASRRLEEAAARQRDLERREAALTERERQIQAQTATPSPVDEGDDDEIQAAIDALVEGDNETAAKLLKAAVKKGRTPATPPVDTEEIAARAEAAIEAKLAAKENARAFQEFVAANPVFAEPTPDEEGNVLLSPQRVRGDYLFDTLYAPKWQKGEISYREALNKTAEHVEREFAPVAPTPAPAPSEREARKAKIDTIPVAHGAKPALVQKTRTAEEAIAEMASWRGQGT